MLQKKNIINIKIKRPIKIDEDGTHAVLLGISAFTLKYSKSGRGTFGRDLGKKGGECPVQFLPKCKL